jgi:hypothetical protein
VQRLIYRRRSVSPDIAVGHGSKFNCGDAPGRTPPLRGDLQFHARLHPGGLTMAHWADATDCAFMSTPPAVGMHRDNLQFPAIVLIIARRRFTEGQVVRLFGTSPARSWTR